MVRSSRLALIAAALVVLAALPLVVPSFYVFVLTKVLIFALLAMALDVVFGYGGMPSLGHAAFFGTGGYVVGIGLTRWGWGFGEVLLVALVLGALLGAIMGLLTIRTEGIYLLLLTLAVAQSLWALAFEQVEYTRGDNGISGITRETIPFGLVSRVGYYEFVLAVVVVAALCLWQFTRSPVGRALVASRESRVRLEGLGYRTWAYRVGAFTLSGTVAALAGLLLVYLQGIASPELLYWTLSAEVLVMAVVGGAGTLLGPAVGAAIIVLLEQVVSSVTERWITVLGALYILAILFLPDGLAGLGKRLWRPPAAPSEPEPEPATPSTVAGVAERSAP